MGSSTASKQDGQASEPTTSQPLSARWYLATSLLGLLIAIGLLLLFVLFAPRLLRYGIDGKFFYFLLVPLGLATAAFVFGAMRSVARLTERDPRRSVDLGGPIVAALLVVYGGFNLVPGEQQTFSVTVRVVLDDTGSPIATGEGDIMLFLGQDPRSAPIAKNGEANFKEIPWKFRGAKVELVLEAPGYSWVNKDYLVDLSEDTIVVRVVGSKTNAEAPSELELIKQAQLLLAQGEIQAGEKVLDEAISEFGGSPEPWYWKARVARTRNNLPVVVALTDKAIATDDSHVPSWVLRISALLAMGGENITRAREAARLAAGKSEDLDAWIRCLADNDLYTLTVVRIGEIEHLCGPIRP